MATGIFKLRDQLQGLITKAWYGSGQLLNSWSSYAGSFNGSSQYLTLASNTAFNVFGGNMTIECWFYANSIGASPHLFAFVETSTNRESIYFNGQALTFYSGNGSGSGNNIATPALSAGVWYHMALVKSGSTFTLFLNGVAVGTSTTTYYSTANQQLQIGTYNSAGYAPDCFNGYISNVRVVKGTAVYTNSFVPPVLNLTNITNTSLLTLQNATIIDNSSNAFSITNSGSVATSTQTINLQITQSPNAYATPAVEYLVVAGGGGGGGNLSGGGGGGGLLQGILPITTGTPLTVTIGTGGAGSASTTGTTGVDSVFSSITAKGGGGGATAASGLSGGSGGGTAQYGIGSVGGSGISGQGNAGGTSTSGSGSTITGSGGGGAGTVGIGGTSSLGGNGGAGIASSISGTVTAYAGGGAGGAYAGQTAGIGGVGGGGRGADATNAAVAGTANTGGGGGGSGYPTNPTGQAGGSGICIISYPDIYNAPASFGGANSPTASTSGSGSMYFNNPAGVSNQAVTYTTTSAQSLGAGDFCIEAFVWWSSSSGGAPYVATNYVGSTNYYWGLYQQTTIQFYVYGGVYLNAGSFTNNTWNHIVVCRTSGTTSMFLNGTRTATASDSVTYATGATSLYVGQNNINANMFNGYISNFRIVVGNSIYSASATSITVPTAPFAVTSQTKVLLGTVSPNAYLESASALTPTLVSNTGSVTWNQLSPFATGLGYKNRVYTWTGNGTVTF